VYPVIADPPLLAGAVTVTVAEPDAVLDAETDVGAPGTVAGTTLDDAVDADEVNKPLFAVTANVYAVPFVNPETVQEVAGALTVQVAPFGEAVTV
jgi:hypothetical protein